MKKQCLIFLFTFLLIACNKQNNSNTENQKPNDIDSGGFVLPIEKTVARLSLTCADNKNPFDNQNIIKPNDKEIYSLQCNISYTIEYDFFPPNRNDKKIKYAMPPHVNLYELTITYDEENIDFKMVYTDENQKTQTALEEQSYYDFVVKKPFNNSLIKFQLRDFTSEICFNAV